MKTVNTVNTYQNGTADFCCAVLMFRRKFGGLEVVDYGYIVILDEKYSLFL